MAEPDIKDAPEEKPEDQSADQPEPSQPTQGEEEAQDPNAPEDQPEVKEEEKVEEEEDPKPPSRRESLRIQKLLTKLKEQQPEKTPELRGIDYSKELEADPEVIAKLQADRDKVAKEQYHEGLEEAKSIQFHTRLEIDAPKVEGKFPQLNPEDKERFNPVLADAVNSWYLSMVGYDTQTRRVANSNLRYADFVEGLFELAEEMAGEKVDRTSKNIARQAATTGLRPDGSQAKRLNLNKAPEDMTDEELKAVIGQMPATR